MDIAHETAVWFSKSFGLFYLIIFAVAVLIYVFWPSNRKRFERAAKSIFHGKDKP
jgi:cytochrome c oxidase cbb3-type subunit 4